MAEVRKRTRDKVRSDCKLSNRQTEGILKLKEAQTESSSSLWLRRPSFPGGALPQSRLCNIALGPPHQALGFSLLLHQQRPAFLHHIQFSMSKSFPLNGSNATTFSPQKEATTFLLTPFLQRFSFLLPSPPKPKALNQVTHSPHLVNFYKILVTSLPWSLIFVDLGGILCMEWPRRPQCTARSQNDWLQPFLHQRNLSHRRHSNDMFYLTLPKGFSLLPLEQTLSLCCPFPPRVWRHQAHSCLSASALAVPSAWNALLPQSLALLPHFIQWELKCHFLRLTCPEFLDKCTAPMFFYSFPCLLLFMAVNNFSLPDNV